MRIPRSDGQPLALLQWSRWSINSPVILQQMIVEQQGLTIARLQYCRPTAILVWSEKPYFLLQKCLGILFCENKNSLAPQWYKIPTIAICWYVFENLIRMLLVLHWALSNCLWPLWDSFHAFKIKITNTPHILLPTSTLKVAQKYAFHPHKNTLIILTWLFILQKEYGLCERKRKNICAEAWKKEKEKEKKR